MASKRQVLGAPANTVVSSERAARQADEPQLRHLRNDPTRIRRSDIPRLLVGGSGTCGAAPVLTDDPIARLLRAGSRDPGRFATWGFVRRDRPRASCGHSRGLLLGSHSALVLPDTDVLVPGGRGLGTGLAFADAENPKAIRKLRRQSRRTVWSRREEDSTNSLRSQLASVLPGREDSPGSAPQILFSDHPPEQVHPASFHRWGRSRLVLCWADLDWSRVCEFSMRRPITVLVCAHRPLGLLLGSRLGLLRQLQVPLAEFRKLDRHRDVFPHHRKIQ